MDYINTNNQIVNILTKALPLESFIWLKDMLGFTENLDFEIEDDRTPPQVGV